jgi:hypothetical protein
MKRMNWLLVAFVVLFSIGFASCTSKDEKLYGKIIAKSKSDRELIEEVRNARFRINENITLKEAVAINIFSENIEWTVYPAEKKGAHIIAFSYDIEPIGRALSTQFLYEVGKEGKVLSPIGYANMFTRFISSELTIPHEDGINQEIKDLLDAYAEYYEGYSDLPIYIPRDELPESLPAPFFNITKARFVGEVFSEPSSDELSLVRYSIWFDFKVPYLDNKEYKNIRMSSSSPAINNQREATYAYGEFGLMFVYEDKSIFEIYPYPEYPILVTYYDLEDFRYEPRKY